MQDPETRFFSFPASDSESYVVRGYHAGHLLELTLSRDARHKHHFNEDTFTPVEILAVKRFRHSEMAAYSSYAGHLEDTAALAARGELGYHVHTAAVDGKVEISLVARLLQADGKVHTEISDQQTFEDPDSSIALVEANERATELRAKAEGLNEEWIERLNADVAAVRAGYDHDDEQAAAAEQLQRLVDAEGD
ncbi:MAG: hypothetical protein ACYDHH_14165 [Solirubrobacteraceae bacterium]